MKIHFFLDDDTGKFDSFTNYVTLDFPAVPQRGNIVIVDENIALDAIGGFELPKGINIEDVIDYVYVAEVIYATLKNTIQIFVMLTNKPT